MVEDILRAADEQMDAVLDVAERWLAALFPGTAAEPVADVVDSVVRRRRVFDLARQRADLAIAALRGIRHDAELRIGRLVQEETVDAEAAGRAANELRVGVAGRVAALQDLLERKAADLVEG